MDGAVLVDDGIAVGRQSLLQCEGKVERAVLVEINDAEIVGGLDFAGLGLDLAAQEAKQGGFAASVRTDQADAGSGGDGEVEIVEEFAGFETVGNVLDFDEAFGFAIRSVELDAGAAGAGAIVYVGQFSYEFVGVVDASFGFGGAGPWDHGEAIPSRF